MSKHDQRKGGAQDAPELRVGNDVFFTWHEAVEREVSLSSVDCMKGGTSFRDFEFPASRKVEPLRDGDRVVAVIIRRHERSQGNIQLSVIPAGDTLFKVSVRVTNQSPLLESEFEDSESVILHLFASTHTILHASNAEFISQTDPPPDLKSASTACQNIGLWPVLIGSQEKGERDTMLASPVILYDYPQIAPQSAGPLFDGTEIDEILSLRILTMTDEEKSEMRGVDEQARRLLERTEALPQDAFLKMHGMVRGAGAESAATAVEFDDFFGASKLMSKISIGGVTLKPGDRVLLRPKARADIIDTALDGKAAIIESLEEDLEQRIHVAVVLENDPGKDLGLLRQPGHRFFYGLDEVEPLEKGVQ